MGNRIKNKRFINLGGSSTEETTQNETVSETSVETVSETTVDTGVETETIESESINLIRPLEENMFYKIFNSTGEPIKNIINNYVPDSLIMKILLSVIISGILLYVYNIISNWINSGTTFLYDNCRMTARGPRCSFSGSKKLEGDEGVYLIKTSYDNNIPITSEMSFYVYLNKYNKISLITDEEVMKSENLINDVKNYNELYRLLKKGETIYITSEGQKNKKILKNINNILNETIYDLDKLKMKSDIFIEIIKNYRELLLKMNRTMGFSDINIIKELKKSIKENKFGGNRDKAVMGEELEDGIFHSNIIKEDIGFGTVDNFEYKTIENEDEYDRIQNEAFEKIKKTNAKIKDSQEKIKLLTNTDNLDENRKEAFSSKNRLFSKNYIKDIFNDMKAQVEKTTKNKMKGGNIYNYSIKFKESIRLIIEELNRLKSIKRTFNKKRLEWIIDSSRDKFIIKSKFNPNITLLYPESRFSIRKYYGDKKLFERKLEVKNMFRSFKNLKEFTNTLRKKIFNIRDNYNIYYKIYYEDKKGKQYLQVNNSNNNYIQVNEKCSKDTGNVIYSGNNYKLCNPFVLKLLCENDRKCKSIIQSHNPNYCLLTDKENIGGDKISLKYCEGTTYFKQEKDNGYIKKNHHSDIIKFDTVKNNGISNWQLIKIGEL
jgi:hypothetical protein